MKNKLFIIIILLMFEAMLLAGCEFYSAHQSSQSEGGNNASEAGVTEDITDQNTDVPVSDKAEWKGKINENGWLKLDLDGRIVLPCQYLISQVTNTEDGQVTSEGVPLGDVLPEVYHDLPTVARGFKLDVYEWGSIRQIAVYNTDFKRIVANTNEYQLFDIIKEHEEELIVDVHIYAAGCEIFEVGWSGTELGYAFRVLSADDTESSAGQYEHEPFVRLYSDGTEVGTKEFFFYSYTAHYYDGAPVGMLHADGEAFFDPNHIAEAYDELPVYNGRRDEGLDIRLKEGAEIRQIYIYDTADGFIRITVADKAALDRFIEDTAAEGREYAVEIVVCLQGDYIEDLGEYEYEANGYAFIVK